MARAVPVHYLRANHSEWTPPAVVFLDTETSTVDEERNVQALRCWVASLMARPAGITDHGSRVDGSGTTAGALASTVDEWSRKHPTLWLYCHNLGFDLTVTRLPLELCALGWEITDFALDGRAPWMRLARGRRRLTLSDSWSWVPRSLEIISGQVGILKPALPTVDDGMHAWLARCRADVDILAAMMTQLMDWWSTTGRGRWSVTGAAAGWNAYRHTPSSFKVVIDPDEEAVSWDRQAVYGGRRSVTRVGRLTPGSYVECDFTRAYTVIARDLPLPTRRTNRFDRLALDDPRINSPRWGVIAEVELETDRPIFPKRDAGRVWYPVGRFRTTLASPEIIRAKEVGALRAIHSGQTYQLAPHMSAWAAWCLDVADDANTNVPGVVRMAARQWGRSVIGKWAQKKYTRIQLGAAPTTGWGYEDSWMADSHVRASMVDLARTRYLCYPDGNGENAFPAVLAFVESHVRQRLGRAIDAIGGDAFVQCDTDGLLCSVAGLMARARDKNTCAAIHGDGGDFLSLVMAGVNTLTTPLVMRVKSVYKRVDVIGPQHLTLDGNRRFSGMSSRAEELADGRLGAWTWPKMAWQMSHGDQRGYVLEYQRYRVPKLLAAGWHTLDGQVLPVEYGTLATGAYGALEWPRTRWARDGTTPAAEQPRDVLALVQSYREGVT